MVASDTGRILANEAAEDGIVISGAVVIETIAVVIAAGKLGRVRARLTGGGSIAEGVIRIRRLDVSAGIGERQCASKRISQRNHGAVAVRTLNSGFALDWLARGSIRTFHPLCDQMYFSKTGLPNRALEKNGAKCLDSRALRPSLRFSQCSKARQQWAF
jgi:hypothetical protein